jgi:hypothetical protein
METGLKEISDMEAEQEPEVETTDDVAPENEPEGAEFEGDVSEVEDEGSPESEEGEEEQERYVSEDSIFEERPKQEEKDRNGGFVSDWSFSKTRQYVDKMKRFRGARCPITNL